MERERKESSKGSAVAAGITCSVIGALLGAVGYHFWKKEEVKLSHSEYVSIPQLIFCLFLFHDGEVRYFLQSAFYRQSFSQTCLDNSIA